MNEIKNSIQLSRKTGLQTFYMGEIVDVDMYDGKKKLSKITEIGTICVWVNHLEDNLFSSLNIGALRKDKLGNLLYG